MSKHEDAMNPDELDDDEAGHPRANPRPPRAAEAKAIEQSLRSDDRVSMWLADPLSIEAGKTLLRLQLLPDLHRMAVMPDVHPSADVCVGCVLGTSELVYPQAIGGDIGCGMSALRLKNTDASALDPHAAQRVLARFNESIDVMVRSPSRRAGAAEVEMPDTSNLRAPHLRTIAQREGVRQLATLGRGNHFVELQRDDDHALWLMVHSGSRAMGQAVAGHYLRLAQREGVRSAMLALRRGSPAGEAYLADQAWCVRYAHANRAGLLSAAARALRDAADAKPDWSTLLDAPHNFVALESFAGLELLVHRKGAAPAAMEQLGLIPGSAGTMSVHVEGRGNERALRSSSHGAGRLLSRSNAKQAVTATDLRRQMGEVAYDERRAHGLRDEAPSVYRDLRRVLDAQRDLVKVVRTLRPLVSFKASG